MTSALHHIEKTLADAYRREIEQGENVWRSLPFFAATIAFQIAALSQVLLRLPPGSSGAWWDAIAAIIALALLIFVAVACLAASIVPAQVSYIPDEPALLSYARSLDADEQDAAANQLPPIDAAATLMDTLAQSYAVTTHHNRKINQQRGLYRSIAGHAIPGSGFLTMFLVARLLLHYMPNVNCGMRSLMDQSGRPDADYASNGELAGEAPQGAAPLSRRRPPPLRLVTQGWFTITEREISVEELERMDRAAEQRP